MAVENEAHNEPQRVLRRVGGRDVARRVEKDGHIDVTHPAIRIAAVEHVDQYGDHRSDQEEEHQRGVNLPGLEHPLRADGAPDQGGVVIHFGSRAGKALSILWGAQIRDVAHHPPEHARLYGSSKNGGVDLANEQNPWRNLHVLAKLEVLSKVHAVFDSVVTKTLDHHVGNGLAGPGIASDQFGDDVQEAIE